MAAVVDPLLALARERDDELTPAWRALIAVLRFWLGMFAAGGSLGVIAIALRLMVEAYMRYGDTGLLSYFVLAMPGCAALVLGVRRARHALARRIADAIRARLAGIGGSLTPASFSLGPRREDRR